MAADLTLPLATLLRAAGQAARAMRPRAEDSPWTAPLMALHGRIEQFDRLGQAIETKDARWITATADAILAECTNAGAPQADGSEAQDALGQACRAAEDMVLWIWGLSVGGAAGSIERKNPPTLSKEKFMPSLNRVQLIGNLGRDPETRRLPDGTPATSASLATSIAWKDKASGEPRERTEWHRLVFWRGLAKVAEKYLVKGSKIYVEGSLRTGKYTDREGIERFSTEIVVRELLMLGARPNAEGSTNTGDPGDDQEGTAFRATGDELVDEITF